MVILTTATHSNNITTSNTLLWSRKTSQAINTQCSLFNGLCTLTRGRCDIKGLLMHTYIYTVDWQYGWYNDITVTAAYHNIAQQLVTSDVQ